MSRGTSYVLVTPARDEAVTIGRTLDSVVGQTIRPAEWVIVSDGSIDATDEIVAGYTRSHPWIRLLKRPRGERSFAAVVRNTELGIRDVTVPHYAYLGLLDADVVFQPNYFQDLISRFQHNPSLGLAGGMVVDIGTKQRVPRNRVDVPGAAQFYRRECFERLGGLYAIPDGGWDAVACVQARMSGFQTQLFVDLVVEHLKPRNVSQGGPLRRTWQLGSRDYAIGYLAAFELLKCAGRALERPPVVASTARWLGYCSAAWRRKPRLVPPRVVAHLRREQIERLQRLVALPIGRPPSPPSYRW